MTQKPQLSNVQIFNMCFGFLGIQIGFDLQNGNVSRIFQTLGAEIDSLPLLWIAAPLTGLLMQPIIGHLSDKTWNRFGRRKPYFLIGALLASLALFVMPNAPVLWVAAGTLWIMDAALNITMEPTRALVGDMLADNQRTKGYAMQSFFIGVGAVLGGMLPYLFTKMGLANVAPVGHVPASVHAAFYVGGAALLLAILYSLATTKEYSPSDLASFHQEDATSVRATSSDAHNGKSYGRNGLVWLLAGALLWAFVWAARLQPRPDFLAFLGAAEFRQDLYVLAGLIAGFGVLQLLVSQMRRANGITEVMADLYAMPMAMRQLAVVQFFTWFGLFAMWIYGTPAVASHHFGAIDAASAAYQDAGNWWGVLSSVRNFVAALAALAIMYLAARFNRRALHAACLLLGAVGFAGMIVLKDPTLLFLPMVGVGIAWAAIVSVPYAILAGSVPAQKMGVYMGIFNIFIVVPQLVAATLLGFLLRTFFANDAIWAFAIAAASFAIAALAVLRMKEQRA